MVGHKMTKKVMVSVNVYHLVLRSFNSSFCLIHIYKTPKSINIALRCLWIFTILNKVTSPGIITFTIKFFRPSPISSANSHEFSSASVSSNSLSYWVSNSWSSCSVISLRTPPLHISSASYCGSLLSKSNLSSLQKSPTILYLSFLSE